MYINCETSPEGGIYARMNRIYSDFRCSFFMPTSMHCNNVTMYDGCVAWGIENNLKINSNKTGDYSQRVQITMRGTNNLPFFIVKHHTKVSTLAT